MTYADNLIRKGVALHMQGKIPAAIRAYKEARKEDPNNPLCHFNLGRAYEDRRCFHKAIEAYREAIRVEPKFAPARVQLGMLAEKVDKQEAIALYEEAARLCPSPATSNNMGLVYKDLRLFTKALAAFKESIALDPRAPSPYFNCATVLNEVGRLEESMSYFEQGMAINPKHGEGRGNMLFVKQHLPRFSAKDIYEAHRDWARRHTDDLPPCQLRPHKPHDRLRIGYLSPDFRTHVVASNFEPVARYHDHKRFQVFMYSMTPLREEDQMTAKIRKYADKWLNVVALTDEQLCAQIMRDEIDVLVDLAGHTGGGRPRVMAMKPAPVGCCWIGWPATTGIKQIDYFITDTLFDPLDAQQYYAEKLTYLPTSIVYSPIEDAPLAEPPCIKNGYVTFGSFNAVSKLHSETVAAWASILRAVPKSRLILKSRPFSDDGVSEHWMFQFAKHGIAPERIELIPWTVSLADHMRLYQRIDIALDTWPFCGGITSFEALWSGVPVVTIAGDYLVRRMSARMLAHLNLWWLVRGNVGEYVKTACWLAGETELLKTLRASMRERLMASPLMDGAACCRELEQLYEQIRK